MADVARLQNTPGATVPEPLLEVRRSPGSARAQPTRGAPEAASFGEILRARQGIAGGTASPTQPAPEVRFSAHAQTRLQSRKIAMDEAHMDRLQGAVQKAASKGSRDALVLMDDLAMVVSVTNRTVVTVVDKENLKQNVFTNIDSAVIA